MATASFRFGFHVDGDDHDEAAPNDSIADGTGRKIGTVDHDRTMTAVSTASRLTTVDVDGGGAEPRAWEVVPLRPDDDRPLRRVVVAPAAADAAVPVDLSDTDLVPGSYEGGLRVWECSLDLCRYLATTPLEHKGTGRVLELGCGHGLPGCLILRARPRATTVLFSDYNAFVLEQATLPNVRLNTDAVDRASLRDRVTLVGGEWTALSDWLHTDEARAHAAVPPDGRFDLVLAAETTYTLQAARETAVLLGRHLRPGTGVGLVATKRYYFGVGGGAEPFRRACAEIGTLTVETSRVYDNGRSNVRELLRVVRRVDGVTDRQVR